MTIAREVNGKLMRFELTPDEMRRAFEEQQDRYLREDIRCRFRDIAFENGTEPPADDIIPAVAKRAQRYLDSHGQYVDIYWWCIEAAERDILQDILNESTHNN